MKRTGLVAYGQQSWIIMKEYSSKTLDFIEATSPEYYKITVETCKPYIKLAGDIYLVMKHISFKIYDNIAEYIEKNGPLVIQTVSLNNFNAKIVFRYFINFTYFIDRALCPGNVG